jgi:hypothetical protein
MTPPPPNALYRPIRFTMYGLDQHRALVFSDELQRTVELRGDAIRVLMGCDGARTLDAHLGNVARYATGADTNMIRELLRDLVSLGLLRALTNGFAQNAHGATSTSTVSITTLGVVTADRPQLLRRCLRSFVNHCEQFGHSPRFLIIDGSSQAKNRVLNQEIAREVERYSGWVVTYIGAVEAAALHASMAKSGIDQSVLEFGLTPGATGAGRNLLLLLTAGENVLFVDDDIVCNLVRLPGSEDALSVGGHEDLRSWLFGKTRSEVLAQTIPATCDLLASHSALLGKDLVSLLSAYQVDPNLDQACRHLVSSFEQQTTASVRATFSGIAGDSGIYCPYRLLFHSGSVRKALLSDETVFATAVASREVCRIAKRTLVTHEPFCMAYCMGLANQTVSGAFLPVGRNSDGIFGALLGLCDPQAAFGHLAHGVIHDSARPPAYPPEMISASQTRIADLVLSLLRRTPGCNFPSTTAMRLQKISSFLAELGTIDSGQFRTVVTDSVLDSRCRELSAQAAMAMSSNADYPLYWFDTLEAYRDTFIENVKRPEMVLPVDICSDRELEKGFVATQIFCTRFGEFIKAWPALWEHARMSDLTSMTAS